MQSELYSLARIFTESLLRIPDYQRGYSWTEKQLAEFWRDILILKDGRDHYTGVLTLEAAPERAYALWEEDIWIIRHKRFRPYYVVDGQQRLTSAIILIQSIIDATDASKQISYFSHDEIRKKYIYDSRNGGLSRSYIFGYEKDNPSYEFLKTRVFKEPSAHFEAGAETAYTQNLQNAKDFFDQCVKTLSLAEIESLFQKVTQHLLFNVYTIAPGIDVFVAFEVMNNRGKPLSYLELLKNRLIYLSTLIESDDDERRKIRTEVNESWKWVYHFLGKNKYNPQDDDRFLFTHFIVYFAKSIKQVDGMDAGRLLWVLEREEAHKKYLVDKFFTPSNICGVSPIPEEQGVILSRPLDSQEIHSYAADLRLAAQRYFDISSPELSSLPEKQKIALTRIERMDWGDYRPLVLAAFYCGAPASDLNKFLEALERYAFLTAGGIDYRPKALLSKYTLQLRRETQSLLHVADELETHGTNVASQLFSSTRAQWLNRDGYYGWRALKYFLFEYEMYLKSQSKTSREKISWEEFRQEDYVNDFVTVEHIYPQKASDPYWRNGFHHLSVGDRNKLRQSLGNLMALSRPKNASLGNRSFIEKRDGLDGSPAYRNGSYSEIEVARETDWGPMQIIERGLRLLDFMETRWKIKIGGWDEKLAVLGLEGVRYPRSK